MNKAADEKRKNAAAIMVMQRTLEKYADRYNAALADALQKFVSTPIYDVLFDFETGLWREGPDYILELFERAIGEQRSDNL